MIKPPERLANAVYCARSCTFKYPGSINDMIVTACTLVNCDNGSKATMGTERRHTCERTTNVGPHTEHPVPILGHRSADRNLLSDHVNLLMLRPPSTERDR
jgi:hypothetical protein